MRGHRWTDEPAAQEALKRGVPKSVGDAFALIEQGMLAGPRVMGEQFPSAMPTCLPSPVGWKAMGWTSPGCRE
jgi:hypothetical protein